MAESVSIAEAQYLDGYRIRLAFNTGESGVVDLRDLVFQYRAAESLRDPARFAEFHLDSWPTLAWDCGFDVDPESLYDRALGKKPTAIRVRAQKASPAGTTTRDALTMTNAQSHVTTRPPAARAR